MTERGLVRFGDTTIDYAVIRSRRRHKTVAITLDPQDGVVVAAPIATPSDRVREIVTRRAAWIVRQASAEILHPRRKAFVSGESLPYLGRQARLFVEHANVRWPTLTFRHWSFHLIAPARLAGEERQSAIQKAVTRWYKARAADRLTGRVQRWAKLAESAPSAVLIRDQRQRWASCGPDGSMRFNWRIIMAPPTLIDYVVVHELIHLRFRNHSAEFWTELLRLMPDYRLRRAALKEIGPTLTL